MLTLQTLLFQVGNCTEQGLPQIHAFGKMPECFFFIIKLLFCYKCQIGWQRDDHDCVEESYNQIKTNELLFWCVCVCVHNFHCVNLIRQTQIVAIQGAENNCRSE